MTPITSGLVSLAEKAVATYLQALVVALSLGDTLDLSTVQAAAFAAIPAALTVVMNALPVAPVGLPFVADVAWRAARTFVAMFLGYLVALPTFSLDPSVLTAASSAALAGMLAVVKGVLATRVGFGDSAAMLPRRVDPGA